MEYPKERERERRSNQFMPEYCRSRLVQYFKPRRDEGSHERTSTAELVLERENNVFLERRKSSDRLRRRSYKEKKRREKSEKIRERATD